MSAGREGGPASSVPSLREPRYSQSLERGLAILSVFTPTRPVLGIADIADGLGMSRSTTHRYVITLVALGYLEQNASRKYRLGVRVTDLGVAALHSSGLRELAHPYLLELRERSSRTTSLGVLDGSEVLYIDRVRSFRRGQSAIEPDLHPGSRVPAYCTAIGKLLLAHLPEPEQHELIKGLTLTKRARHTITSKKALREQLEQISGTGIASSEEELAADVLAIAAPVRNQAGAVIAAVSIAARRSLLSPDELSDAPAMQLQQTAEQISAQLGYQPDIERAS